VTAAIVAALASPVCAAAQPPRGDDKAAARGAPAPLPPDDEPVASGPEATAFRSAETCRPCHPEIYDEWRGSAMARSVELSGWSLFSSLAVLRANGEGERIRGLCYACHAPFARASGALDLKAAPLHEGVSCDYCHSLRAVEASPRINVATVVPGDVKTGPHADAVSPGHGTLALPLMRRSELCAGCHYFAWPATGMPMDWTYAQWAASPYRSEGIECQGCHMPRRAGRSSNVAGTPDRGGVASHRFAGARDLATLQSALALRARREGGVAVVEVENVGAGHNVPGGGGELRQLELRFRRTGTAGRGEVRQYDVRYFDEDGRRVSGSDDGAARFVDTTLAARETRVERFALALETGARVELWFWYVAEEVARRDGGKPESVLVAWREIAPATPAGTP
jgi:hypothetical protein